MSARISPASFEMSSLEPRTLLSAQSPADLIAVGNRLFFTAEDGVHGRELWVSDGTAAGTRMVRDIGPGSAGANFYGLTPFGNRLAFTASDGSHGRELWVSDGTAAGTFMVKDILNGSQEGFPTSLKAIGNTLYFSAGTSSQGRELWKSDGTAAGTVLVKDINAGSNGSGSLGFTEVNGTIFFSAESQVTTGQGGHTTTTYYGRELWKTDGTAAGTVMVKDIRPGFGDSSPTELVNLNGTLLFSAYTDLGWELWRSNGTSAGTVLVKDINPTFRSGDPRGLRLHGGEVYFNAIDGNFDQNLWRSDGTEAGTEIATEFAPGFNGVFTPANFIEVGDSVFFAAIGQTLGLELWRTDHTAGGTAFVKQILSPEVFQTNPYIQPAGGRGGQRMFFTAFDPAVLGLELYIVNGTTATLLRDIFPGNTFSPSPQNFTDANGMLFFTADDGVHGSELWVSDGTTAGTRRVDDPAPSPNPRSIRVPIGAPSQTDGATFGGTRIADFLNSDEEPLVLD
jgi:trimeric autotransporter adhesin